MTYLGGAGYQGSSFKISPSGTFSTLHNFYYGGAHPVAGLVQGSDGAYYGVTDTAIFRLALDGTVSVLYTFTGGTDGMFPSRLAAGSDGYLYGTTPFGGISYSGSVFRVSVSGALTILYSFTGFDDGYEPLAGLIQGMDGNFYGTTVSSGANYAGGTIFKLTPDGTETTLYNFPTTESGGDMLPLASLTQNRNGELFGTTVFGGANNDGTAFKISPTGRFVDLHDFNGSDGDRITAGPVRRSLWWL